MRDELTSSDAMYDAASQQQNVYPEQPYDGSAYSQTPLDAQGAAGFKKVHARGTYGQNASARTRDRSSERGSAAADGARKALGTVGSAVGGALGSAKDAVVGAASGLVGHVGGQRGQDGAAQLSEDDYAGVGDPCRVCGQPVGPTQERCPHCGAFRKPLWQYPAFIAATVATLALVVLFSILLNSCSSPATPVEPVSPDGTEVEQTGGDGQDGTAEPGETTVASEARVGLAGAIASAQSTYDAQVSQRTYTIYSVAKLGRAIDAANAVYVDSSASDETVNQATADLNNAVSGLTIMPGGEGYVTPAYGDLVNEQDYYFETLVVMSGTVQTMGTEGDVTTVNIAINGDPDSMLQLTYRASELFSDAPAPGNELLFYGTVSGTAPYTNGNGETVQIPAVVGDYVVLL